MCSMQNQKAFSRTSKMTRNTSHISEDSSRFSFYSNISRHQTVVKKISAFIYIFYIYCFSLYSNNSRPKIDIIKIISCVSFYIMRLISMEIKIKFAKSFVQGKSLDLAQTQYCCPGIIQVLEFNSAFHKHCSMLNAHGTVCFI